MVKSRFYAVKGISGAQLFRLIAFSKLLLALVTLLLVSITWVFFRSPDFATAWGILTSMFTTVKGGAVLLTTLAIIKIAVIITLMLAFHWFMKNSSVQALAGKLKWWALGLVWSAMLILLILSQESSSSFIYFQF